MNAIAKYPWNLQMKMRKHRAGEMCLFHDLSGRDGVEIRKQKFVKEG